MLENETLNNPGQEDEPPSQAHHRPETGGANTPEAMPLEEELGTNDAAKDDLLMKLPNVFRLLDLYQESSSGGLTEKVLIDQNSLRRLLSQLSPGSYESVSKIHFKILDKLMIEPIGVYGCEPEIIKFLQGVNCLSDESARLLASSVGSPEVLRSGLYLTLPQRDDSQSNATYRAYIVYWPEASTWVDDVISSVEKNRVTFMHYLSKLTDQTIALVSAEQAEAMVWPGDVDSDDSASDIGDDELAGYKYVVDRVKESEEDVIVNPGFMVKVTPRDVPGINDASQIDLVAGEEKTGLRISWSKPARRTGKPFDEIWTELYLRSVIKSAGQPLILGQIPLEQIVTLGSNGLRHLYPQLFHEYDNLVKLESQARIQGLEADALAIDSQITQDEPRLRTFIIRTIREIYHEIFP
ncbi:hypothetical protein FRC10_006675 [Ceratobasidium sp. 414]|nr:hypothetical protein FRC10_006675 [Ceratobasidium sp. 414]